MKKTYAERDYTFGQVMLTLRNKIGLTQEQLGLNIGVSGRAVSEWETGNSYPKAERLKVLIALAVQQQAFTSGHETEEIRALWKVARQRVLLDEHWLSTLFHEQAHTLDIASPAVPETTHHTPAANPPATETKENCNDAPVVPALHKHEDANASKMTRRHTWLLRILIALVILTIIGSIGRTLFFQASKTAIAGYLSGKGTLVFFDPLSQEDGSEWTSHSIDRGGGSCQFTAGAYHVSQQQNGILKSCPAFGIFTNFAFEVTLIIVQGDCGGVVFRDNGRGNFYDFKICQNGRYEVTKYINNSAYNFKDLSQGSSGLSPHKIAVVATGGSMTFYVNERQIDQAQDSSYTSGHITLTASIESGHTTDIAYSNARLWTL